MEDAKAPIGKEGARRKGHDVRGISTTTRGADMRPWAVVGSLGLALGAAMGAVRAEEDSDLSHPAVLSAEIVIAQFTEFAGSIERAAALVDGLRNGTEIVLAEAGEEGVRFTSPAGPLGYGNVSVALSLAQMNLAIYGVLAPTGTQIAAALTGGEIVVKDQPVGLRGVLDLRAQGMPWSHIAEELGYSLGDAISLLEAKDASSRLEIAARRQRRAVEIIEHSRTAEDAALQETGRPAK
jgi:hypothetical protein